MMNWHYLNILKSLFGTSIQQAVVSIMELDCDVNSYHIFWKYGIFRVYIEIREEIID